MTNEEKRRALEVAFLYLSKQQPFYGGVLQELYVRYSNEIPTLAVHFNDKTEVFEVIINPEYFINHLDRDLKVSGLHHEILHFTNKHLFRVPWLTSSKEDRSIMNIAGDMAINQYLNKIAKGCDICKDGTPHASEEEFISHKCPGKWVDINDFKMDDGSTFPKLKDLETYYDLIKQEKEKQANNPKTKGNVNEMLSKLHHGDEHDWDQLDEITKQKMIDEAKKVLQRSIEKTQFSHSVVPEGVRDFLKELETMSDSMNHKRILNSVIKKTVSCVDRTSTWHKPNKRYGVYAPGSKLGALPQLKFYHDHSGSISVTEQNTFLRIMDDFLSVGVRKCILSLWHTSIFYTKPYKKGFELKEEELESGGTDINCVMEDIQKTKPDLAIILTDGYYDRSPIIPKNSEVLFIISSGGNQEHPMKHVGKTLLLDLLKQ